LENLYCGSAAILAESLYCGSAAILAESFWLSVEY